MIKNIAAYTNPRGNYPGYVSINRTESGDVSITVRAESTPGSEGAQAKLTIPAAEWERIKAS